MEETQIIIIGAGPSGLALGLALAKLSVRSVILEKETGITTDPRGVYLTGDAIRILYDLGIGPDINTIGHEVHKVNFHRGSFSEKPFFSLNLGTSNILKHAVPEGMLQSQPKLEKLLRDQVEQSEWCTLRTGCTVVSRTSEEPPIVEYVTEHKIQRQIRGQWLVGADGKLGIVRKHFLEPTTNIRQEEGTYRYSGTWIAANLKISVPTPQSHPQFSLWKLGFSPTEVYDLFWPEGWHFCCPPGKATATGRFGPHSDKTWRHELRQDDWDDSMNAEELFWQHITPMITRTGDEQGRRFSGPVEYPRDCIEILRCRPFKFAHKVVTRWFHKRTILIGDAAHVFPPFAGQGIGSGVRDAHQLAWRLALLTGNNLPTQTQVALYDNILQAWALERRKSIDDAAWFSMLNGKLCNNTPSVWLRVALWFQMLLESSPILPSLPNPEEWKERQAFTNVKGGFFLKEYNGGARLAQIHIQRSPKEASTLSDQLLRQSKSLLTVLIIASNMDYRGLYDAAKSAVTTARVDPYVLSEDSIVVFKPHANRSSASTLTHIHNDSIEVFSPSFGSQLPRDIGPGYDERAYVHRLGKSTQFALLRPDFFVFACAKNMDEFERCLALLKKRLENLE